MTESPGGHENGKGRQHAGKRLDSEIPLCQCSFSLNRQDLVGERLERPGRQYPGSAEIVASVAYYQVRTLTGTKHEAFGARQLKRRNQGPEQAHG
jgi:hypothetical protein